MEQPAIPTVDASGAALSANSKDFENEIARFKAAWQRDERPTIEVYLPVEPQRRQQLLIELVLVELELRIKVGETARVEEYLARFPELSEASDFAVKLVTHEFYLRRQREPDLSPVDYGRRFPQLPTKKVAKQKGQADLTNEDDSPAMPEAMELPLEMIEPQPPAPMPEPDIHVPPLEATRKHEAVVKKALAAVRASLGDRDLESAQEQLGLATLDAVTPDLEAAVERLQVLTQYVEQFWKVVSESLLKLDAGEEFTINGVIGAVVEARADMLIIRVQGTNREYPLHEIPTKLAVLMAERSLDKADKQTPVVIGAFLLADPNGDDQEARQLFQQAATKGVDVVPLLKELESRDP